MTNASPKQHKTYEAMRRQRWFPRKEATIRSITPFDTIPLSDGYGLGIYNVLFEDAGIDTYLVPTKKGHMGLDVIAEEKFLAFLFDAIRAGGEISAEKGTALFHKFGDWHLSDNLNFGLLDSGSSNTLITCKGNAAKHILKLLRRLHDGQNVESEVNRFLLEETGFRNAPPIRAGLSYKTVNGKRYHLATMFDFIENRGSGWDWTVKFLKEMVKSFLKEKSRPTEATVGLSASPYNEGIYRLGKVLADLHLALASGRPGSGFDMQPMQEDDILLWQEQVRSQAGRTFSILKQLAPETDTAIQVLAREDNISKAFDDVHDVLKGLRYKIRQHADFHLGQVLISNDTFYIIDFEGEPLKPYAERAAHYTALKDVAGICRSFNYAAFSAYLSFKHEIMDSATLNLIQEIYRHWEVMARRSLLDGYFQELKRGGALFLPTDDRIILKRVLALHELEKALYEAEYEVRNRPDWLSIPLGGIINCLHALG